MHVTRVKTGYHEAVTVSAQALPQERCELRVSVRHKPIPIFIVLLCKRRNDLSESHQTFIDLYRFLGSHISGLALPFGPGQVHKLKGACHTTVRITGVNTLDGQLEHTVRSTRGVVHIVAGDNSVLEPKVIQCQDVLSCLALEGVQILNCKDIFDEFKFQARTIFNQSLKVALIE